MFVSRHRLRLAGLILGCLSLAEEGKIKVKVVSTKGSVKNKKLKAKELRMTGSIRATIELEMCIPKSAIADKDRQNFENANFYPIALLETNEVVLVLFYKPELADAELIKSSGKPVILGSFEHKDSYFCHCDGESDEATYKLSVNGDFVFKASDDDALEGYSIDDDEIGRVFLLWGTEEAMMEDAKPIPFFDDVHYFAELSDVVMNYEDEDED